MDRERLSLRRRGPPEKHGRMREEVLGACCALSVSRLRKGLGRLFRVPCYPPSLLGCGGASLSLLDSGSKRQPLAELPQADPRLCPLGFCLSRVIAVLPASSAAAL